MPKLTQQFVEKITPGPEKIPKFWDAELKDFGLIVLPSGSSKERGFASHLGVIRS